DITILVRMLDGAIAAPSTDCRLPCHRRRTPAGAPKMSIAVPFLVFLLVGAFSAYHRLRLPVWAALTAVALVACWLLGANGVATAVAGIIAALIAVPLLLPQIRLPFISTPLLGFYTKILPPLSETERSAIEAGTVGFEGEL